MFASFSTRTIPIPFNSPHTVTLQKLSGKQVERAQTAHLAETIAGRSSRGWAGIFQRSLANGTATEEDVAKALADPLSGVDRLTVAKAGIKAWTCTTPAGQPLEVSPQTVEDLDDEALEWMATEIWRLTKPRLFETDATAGADRKNGSRGSTAA